MRSIVLHTDSCIGSGACAFEAPEVFELNDEGVVALTNEHPSDTEWVNVRRAASVCPASVIELVEDQPPR